MADKAGLALSIVAAGLAQSGGGGGEPSQYLKSASVEDNTLTLTNKDNTTVTFTPELPDVDKAYVDGEIERVEGEIPSISGLATETYVDDAVSGKQDTLTAGTNITIDENNVISASGGGSAEGVVRYDEAQTLTDTQFNQVMSNIKLGAALNTYSQDIFDLTVAAGQWGGGNSYTFNSNPLDEHIVLPSSSRSMTAAELDEYTFTYTVNGNTYTVKPSSGTLYSDNVYMNFTQPTSEPYRILYASLKKTGVSSYISMNSGYSYTGEFTGSMQWEKSQITPIDKKYIPEGAFNDDGTNLYAVSRNSVTGDRNLVLGTFNSNYALPSEVRNSIIISNSSITSIDNNGYYTHNIIVGLGNIPTNYKLQGAQNNKSYNVIISAGNQNQCLGGSSYSTILGGSYNLTYANYQVVTGKGNIAATSNQTVIGKYNAYNKWTLDTEYKVGDIVVYQLNGDGNWLTAECKQNHTSASSNFNTTYWNFLSVNYNAYDYAFIIGNGTDNANRSNALTVDWDGNLVCNNIPAPPTEDGEYDLHCSIVSGVVTYSWTARS